MDRQKLFNDFDCDDEVEQFKKLLENKSTIQPATPPEQKKKITEVFRKILELIEVINS